ncbi:QWRF motif-containing protein 3-like [Juglans microcarpa x Juglans regia]|uniref:QWRF motif-containing protein 3-like n=1 Tax=Juglans microcarpa x Juglans regia TaxID=2249226 RepID=UPI001B7E76CF|nr:QWRF motif-containing protein 3-like [Juglans microcarpa x Juglans regia]
MCAWDALTKLQHFVVEKKLQVEKEKLDMMLNNILCSQIKLLEAWEDMERPHISVVSRIVECLHIVVSKVPLTDGSGVDIELAKITLGGTLDLTTSIKSICTNLAPSTENTVTLLSELAEVVAQENFLLEWCLELLKTTSTLELQERSLKCSNIQLKLLRQQQQQQKQEEIPLYTLEV